MVYSFYTPCSIEESRKMVKGTILAIGGELFGDIGALIGSTLGESYTVTRTHTKNPNSVFARVRYSNGLLAEGVLSWEAPAYHYIVANLQSLASCSTMEAEPGAYTLPTNMSALALAERNAIKAANGYLSSKHMSFSQRGLIEQLEYDGYSASVAETAVDRIAVDWKHQAAKSAQSYMNSEYLSFSPVELTEQLEHDGFTAEEAEFGVKSVGY